jgi:hypothetical protein
MWRPYLGERKIADAAILGGVRAVLASISFTATGSTQVL